MSIEMGVVVRMSVVVTVSVNVTAVVRVAMVRNCRDCVDGPTVTVAEVGWIVAAVICPLFPLVGQLAATACQDALAGSHHLGCKGELLAIEDEEGPVLFKLMLHMEALVLQLLFLIYLLLVGVVYDANSLG